MEHKNVADESDVRELVEVQKMSWRDAAKKLGVSRWTIQQRCKKYGIQGRPMHAKGKDAYCWKGGRAIDKDGYVLVYAPDHPTSRKNGRILEHRLVMEKYLGRPLKSDEVIHHINEDTTDNRIENLALYENKSDHLKECHAGNPRRDAMLRLMCLYKTTRIAILRALIGDAELSNPDDDRSRGVAVRDVREACEQLLLPIPPWFEKVFGPTTKPNPPALS